MLTTPSQVHVLLGFNQIHVQISRINMILLIPLFFFKMHELDIRLCKTVDSERFGTTDSIKISEFVVILRVPCLVQKQTHKTNLNCTGIQVYNRCHHQRHPDDSIHVVSKHIGGDCKHLLCIYFSVHVRLVFELGISVS